MNDRVKQQRSERFLSSSNNPPGFPVLQTGQRFLGTNLLCLKRRGIGRNTSAKCDPFDVKDLVNIIEGDTNNGKIEASAVGRGKKWLGFDKICGVLYIIIMFLFQIV
ncbi:unnamed protein product [Lactuca virosa]|uniref:Uncharacterized protein n=1 Tax=Lactuca virosa TaxID=75947 RepID=A0AAU9PE73_9ASTR|nr:unnamed protein product [Lactuca virosa]